MSDLMQRVTIGKSKQDELDWELDDKGNKVRYVEFRGAPNCILVDNNIDFVGISVTPYTEDYEQDEDYIHLYVEDIVELTKGYDGIRFVWEDSYGCKVSKIVKCSRNNDKLELGMWCSGWYLTEIHKDDRLKHPLHEKYGDKGLRLSKAMIIDADTTTLDSEVFKTTTNKYYLEGEVFNILDNKGNIVDKLVMSREEIIYNILLIDENDESDEFYERSLLNIIYMSNSAYAMPYMEFEQHYLKSNLRKGGQFYGLEFESLNRSNEQIEKWKNKMIMSGYEVNYKHSTLLSLKDDFSKSSEQTVITIPDFLGISQEAFLESSITKIRITSPDTLLLPEITCIGTKQPLFYNKYNRGIDVEYTCKKESKYFNTPLKQLFVSYCYDYFWRKNVVERDGFLLEIEVPLNNKEEN